jgi:hypothetical protein
MPTITEKTVAIAHRMMEARRTVRQVWGARWRANLQPFIDQVRTLAAETKHDDLRAGMEIMALLSEQPDTEHTILAVLAATVEILDPTPDGEPLDKKRRKRAR